jgi:hypothetical protein
LDTWGRLKLRETPSDAKSWASVSLFIEDPRSECVASCPGSTPCFAMVSAKRFALLLCHHPTDDVTAKEIYNHIGHQEDAFLLGRELRYVPRPDLIRRGRRERRLCVGVRRALISALACLPGLGEHAIERPNGSQALATAKQCRVDLRWGLVHEFGEVKGIQDFLPFGVRKPTRIRASVGNRFARFVNRLSLAVERRTAHAQSGACGVEWDDARVSLFDRRDHFASPSSPRSGRANPSTSCIFLEAQ